VFRVPNATETIEDALKEAQGQF